MRRRSRECALQILYQLEATCRLDQADEGALQEGFGDFWASFEAGREVDRTFAERLVRGVVEKLSEIDSTLREASHRWKLERMTQVDRNLLRVAAYEITHCVDVPASVTINEALEIAKRFSGGESVSFINGILDHVAKRHTEQL